MNLSDKSELIKYLKENYLLPKKGMGQNFLVDESALNKIVDAADIQLTDTVLEIGPGLGVLTDRLIEKADKVIAVEKDDRLSILLTSKYQISIEKQNDKIQIINADILDTDSNKLMPSSYKLIANIPYYITGRIFKKFLEAQNKPEIIVMLVQKEVAERIVAKVGKMSVLAVSVQCHGEPEIVDIIKADSFFPSPNVDSAILKVRVEERKWQVDEKDFMRCVKHGFASKRKTLINNLSAGYQLEKNKIEDIIVSVGLNKNVRAQELSLDDWEKISKKFV